MNRINLILIIFGFLTISSCSKTNCKAQVIANCQLTYELNPVCGCNDKTYGNPSSAKCSGIEDFTMGACK